MMTADKAPTVQCATADLHSIGAPAGDWVLERDGRVFVFHVHHSAEFTAEDRRHLRAPRTRKDGA